MSESGFKNVESSHGGGAIGDPDRLTPDEITSSGRRVPPAGSCSQQFDQAPIESFFDNPEKDTEDK